jgi:septal ring factor EnvC (AmiA/AmiB activator)
MFSFIETVFEKKLAAFILVLALWSFSGTIAAAEPQATVTSDKLHVRQNPDKESRSVMILPKGVVVSVTGSTADNGWLEITHKGIKGYVRNRETYIRVASGSSVKQGSKRGSSRVDVEKEIAKHSREIQKIGSKIKKYQGDVRVFSEKENTIIRQLNDIDKKLNRSRMSVGALKRNLNIIKEDMDANTKEKEALHVTILKNEAYISKRIIALYKLYHMGKMNVLASADSMYELINRQRSLEFILREDEKILGAHLENMARLKKIDARLAEHKIKAETLEKEVIGQIRDIEGSKQRRSVLLTEIRQKKIVGLAAISSLKESAKALDQTIRSLDQGFAKNDKDEPMIITAFTARKGQLRMPVKGKVVKFFGKSMDNEFKVETFQSGIQVRADRGEPVQAVGAGQVLFSDWLKGYGNLIIIDHGNSYYSLYGHTEEVFKHKGDKVEDREVIATVGDTGSLSGSLLHFEIRHKGEPLDPMTWLKK